MKQNKQAWTSKPGPGLAGLAMAGVLALAGCGRITEETLTIGSKDFTEQFIVAEIMAQCIEEHTDLNVRRRTNLGGTMICHAALLRGDIDLYAEYTGTALTSILGREVIADPDEVYAAVQAAYGEKYDAAWLDPFGFNNTYAITVRASFADQHDIRRISDLADMAETLEAGFTAEFAVREDGYPGLKEIYGFGFGSTRDMDSSLMYRAVARGQVDVISAFATDGRIAAYDLRVLEDDRGFFPPYYAAPVARADVLAEYPQVAEALSSLAGRIDNQTMQRLNQEVDEDGRDPAAVARDFLQAQGLIETD